MATCHPRSPLADAVDLSAGDDRRLTVGAGDGGHLLVMELCADRGFFKFFGRAASESGTGNMEPGTASEGGSPVPGSPFPVPDRAPRPSHRLFLHSLTHGDQPLVA